MFVSNGTITIKAIKGRRGRFCVGDLELPEGSFKVKDEVLDQFEEGRYAGRFVVASVTCDSYMWHGRVITEIRARLGHMQIDAGDEAKPESSEALQPEPDPADQDAGRVESMHTAATPPACAPVDAQALGAEQTRGESAGEVSGIASAPQAAVEPAVAPQSELPSADVSAPPAIETEFLSENERARLALLGQEIYQAIADRAASIQLDPTVGRVKLREQAACLKALGYRFDGPSQTWNLSA